MRNSKPKLRMWFYKANYKPISFRDFIPMLWKGANVQGWSYNRDFTVTWLRYCLRLHVSKLSNEHLSRMEAHDANVKKYFF